MLILIKVFDDDKKLIALRILSKQKVRKKQGQKLFLRERSHSCFVCLKRWPLTIPIVQRFMRCWICLFRCLIDLSSSLINRLTNLTDAVSLKISRRLGAVICLIAVLFSHRAVNEKNRQESILHVCRGFTMTINRFNCCTIKTTVSKTLCEIFRTSKTVARKRIL